MTTAELPEASLLQGAQRALLVGAWCVAAQRLGQAAQLARDANRADDEARCLQMARNLHRLAGDLSQAMRTSAEMPDAHRDIRLRFLVAAERAETLLQAGDGAAAAEQWRAAAMAADELDMPAVPRAAVTRRLALCESGCGHTAVARQLFVAARAAHRGAGDFLGGAWAALEHANCAQEAGDGGAADRALEIARRDAAQLADDGAPPDAVAHLCCEIELARARVLAAQGNLGAAELHAMNARAKALDATSAASYFTAAALTAHYAELRDERVAAYTALATAWVTLGDALGAALARSWLRPLLNVYREKWGGEEFERVQREHDDARRAARVAAMPAA